MNEELSKKVWDRVRLSEDEIKELVYEYPIVDEILGEEHRWTREIKTIIDVDGQYFAIDWLRGLTECQENEFWEQPYPVIKKEEVVIEKKIKYEKI